MNSKCYYSSTNHLIVSPKFYKYNSDLIETNITASRLFSVRLLVCSIILCNILTVIIMFFINVHLRSINSYSLATQLTIVSLLIILILDLAVCKYLHHYDPMNSDDPFHINSPVVHLSIHQ